MRVSASKHRALLSAKRAERDAKLAASDARRKQLRAITDADLNTIKGLGTAFKLLRDEMLEMKNGAAFNMVRFLSQSR